MDFLRIRKKALERAKAKESAPAEPARSEPPPTPPAVEPPAQPPGQPAGAPFVERRRRRGDEQILTDADVLEGALRARLQGLTPAPDARFATWRPGAGPPPVEPEELAWPESHDVPGEQDERYSEPSPSRSGGPATAPDALDPFFYRAGEEEAAVPSFGGAVVDEPIPLRTETIDEFLTFRLGGEDYGVPIEQIREVLRTPPITEVPRAPAHVLGVVTVRGEIVAVIDTRRRLGLGGGDVAAGRIVIVDAGEGPLGLLVDAVAGVVRLPQGSIEPCPQGIAAAATDCVTGIGRWRDRLFMVVDVGALLRRGRPAEAR
jgi:purine-binding chemotaxis protein CheW